MFLYMQTCFTVALICIFEMNVQSVSLLVLLDAETFALYCIPLSLKFIRYEKYFF